MTHKTLTTPGIDLLLKCAVLYLLPTIIFILGFQRLIDYLDVLQALQLNAYLAHGLPILLGVSVFPGYATTRIFWREFKNRREAARLGARTIPKLRGKWIANVDFLQAMSKRVESGYPDDSLTDLVAKYGHVADFYVLWRHLMFTTSPEYIKIVLATDFANYEKGEEFNTVVASLLGNGVFSSDGDMWKFHRSMTRPFFSRDRISHFDLFDRHADAVVAKIKERARAGIPMDFQDLMGRFTLDSATEFLFGACVHSLQGETPFPYNHLSQAFNREARVHPADVFAKAFHEAQTIVARREQMGGLWPLFELRGDKMKGPMKIVDAFINPIIEEAIRKKDAKHSTDMEKEANPADVDEGETLLDHLVKFTSDPVLLKDETLNIMLAGRDTTAGTLTIICYFLSVYPAVAKRLREEILSHVGPNKRPTYEDIRELKYLRAVINETLRLYPIVPFNVRSTINPAVWPSLNPHEKPLYIPAQTQICYSVFMMHRRKDLWGPDAEEFDPDRFLDDRLKKYLISNSFAFLPFNAGPRICLGQQFAYNEMSFMIIRLLQNFESFTLAEDAQPPSTQPPAHWKEAYGTRKAIEKFYPKVNLTMYANGGLWVRAHEE
ncbi:hypothetical protein PC9H_011701 [Pleurotus ostreatus]|uniref:Uncharacterized protein n=1 Tax=Pleurotus ostreatus TaxID=5322 RepID=A0A8H7DN12_PLEOS|nr:uncharacterized protein PC9H_011701 [Pleurotus ostreatus]KAF7421181.1 hypothetical protein PC9H_011701 [Pleurotus ostreatus]KAJ8690729.1 hypothetical protein PTI98_012134 [Pleurotus ostreatus]